MKFKLRKKKKKTHEETQLLSLAKTFDLISLIMESFIKIKFSTIGFNLKKLNLWTKGTHRFFLC